MNNNHFKIISYCLIGFVVIMGIYSCSSKCTIISGRHKLVFNKGELACKCNSINERDSITLMIARKTGKETRYSYCPIIVNDNTVGVFQYWSIAIHANTANFFLFDGKSIMNYKASISEIETFLKDENFNKKEIDQALGKIKTCIAKDGNNSDSF